MNFAVILHTGVVGSVTESTSHGGRLPKLQADTPEQHTLAHF